MGAVKPKNGHDSKVVLTWSCMRPVMGVVDIAYWAYKKQAPPLGGAVIKLRVRSPCRPEGCRSPAGRRPREQPATPAVLGKADGIPADTWLRS